MLFEIGIFEATWPYRTHWTGHKIKAENIEEAEDKAEELGYYRNVDIRIVTS